MHVLPQPSSLLAGLDSHSAHVVVELCRGIAQRKNAVVLMVIHQPDLRIFSLIDHVVLMKEGFCMFENPASNVEQYMNDRGFPKPNEFSTPGWLLEVSQENSHEQLMESGFFSVPEADNNFLECSSRKQTSEDDWLALKTKRLPVATEIKELFARELLLAKRDPFPRLKELGMVFVLSLLVGIVFEGVGKNYLDDPESFGSHVGVVFLVSFNCSIIATISVTSSINSRHRFCREYVSGHYRLISYGIVMMLFEVVFVLACGTVYAMTVFWLVHFNAGFFDIFCIILVYATLSSSLGFAFTSLFDVAEDAQTHIHLVVGPQLLLSGFVAAQQSLAFWIRWMVWLQPLTYSFRLMLNKELAICQEMTDDQRLHLRCLKAYQAGSEFGFSANYDDESVLTVAQAGEYIGRTSILEYLAFFDGGRNKHAMLWDHCYVSKNICIHSYSPMPLTSIHCS